MRPDYLFVIAGAAAALVAALVLLSAVRRPARREWLRALLWTCLAAGLFIQGFAPHLEIRGRQFVIAASGGPVDPKKLVDRERRMQLLSVILAGGAALGLLVSYRQALLPSRSASA